MVRALWAVAATMFVVVVVTAAHGVWQQSREQRSATAALQAALRPDPDGYLRTVRPHLLAARTDGQLLRSGNAVCGELDRSDGDVAALASGIGARGPADLDELAAYTHDMTWIADSSIKWLCPRWVDAYLEQFPTAPPTI
jgi:hypothetical protein